MRTLGIDPSTLLAGWSVAERNELVSVGVWRGKQKDSADRRLYNWSLYFRVLLAETSPDLVVYAAVAYVRNMDTIRKLARAEAAVILPCLEAGIPVIEGRDSQGREIVLGNGGIKKDEVLPALRKLYPDADWLASNRGGGDQADAAVMALAGPTILERQG